MGDGFESPSTYETYIDVYQNRHVKHIIWRFFRKMKDSESAKCTKCKKEISYGQNTNLSIEHLKIEHHYQEDIGFWILRQKFLKSYDLALIKVQPRKTVTFGEIRTRRRL